MDIDVIEPRQPGYPAGLFDLEQPPRLYVTGQPSSNCTVAIVGTRRCTSYGRRIAFSFGLAVARSGWSVISGLARGIDAEGHRGCLSGGGHAVAVLGSGVDVCYPTQNQQLYEEIIDSGGAIVSEYPPGTNPARWRFPERNRIIAAISDAVVVVEAAAKGGALITARLGAEMGRPVFVVPGDVDRESSRGCNLLIKDGAHPVLDASDLVAELGLVLGPPSGTPARAARLPAGGVKVEELPAFWAVTVPEALARLSVMELEGSVVVENGIAIPR